MLHLGNGAVEQKVKLVLVELYQLQQRAAWKRSHLDRTAPPVPFCFLSQTLTSQKNLIPLKWGQNCPLYCILKGKRRCKTPADTPEYHWHSQCNLSQIKDAPLTSGWDQLSLVALAPGRGHSFNLWFCLLNTFLAGICVSLSLSFHSIFYLVLWKRKQSFRCTSSYIAAPLHDCCPRATKDDTVKLRIMLEIHLQPAWTIQTAFEVPQMLSPGASFFSRAAPRFFPSFSTACDAEPLWRAALHQHVSLPLLILQKLVERSERLNLGTERAGFLVSSLAVSGKGQLICLGGFVLVLLSTGSSCTLFSDPFPHRCWCQPWLLCDFFPYLSPYQWSHFTTSNSIAYTRKNLQSILF